MVHVVTSSAVDACCLCVRSPFELNQDTRTTKLVFASYPLSTHN